MVFMQRPNGPPIHLHSAFKPESPITSNAVSTHLEVGEAAAKPTAGVVRAGSDLLGCKVRTARRVVGTAIAVFDAALGAERGADAGDREAVIRAALVAWLTAAALKSPATGGSLRGCDCRAGSGHLVGIWRSPAEQRYRVQHERPVSYHILPEAQTMLWPEDIEASNETPKHANQ